MKRSDINVGDELYYDKSQDWQRSSFGDRVRVVDTGNWVKTAGGTARRAFDGEKGASGVLVVFLLTKDGTPSRGGRHEYVNIAHLRGPYAEVQAKVDEWAEQRRQGNAEAEKMRAATVANVEKIVQRAIAAGFTRAHRDYSYTGDVTIPAADLAALLDVYEDRAR